MDEVSRNIALAEENLGEAKLLLEHGYYRGAVSRGYYSMFHAAKALLLMKNYKPRKHAGVLKTLGLEFVKEGYLEETYAKAFKYAFDMRSKADYNAMIKIDEETAGEIVEEAEKFLNAVKKALKRLI
ncbi:HEPN domain-containing protein [Thermococcus atlanticus]